MDHKKQQELWEQEHKKPLDLLQMDQHDASSGVERFYPRLTKRNSPKNLTGIEMGCGKGRNSIWLAKQGIRMNAFDFSNVAIAEAQKRSKEQRVETNVEFIVHDAIESWPYESKHFDFAIDCFASTDMESFEGRVFARNEYKRVLKPNGFLMVYTLSTDDEFHKEMIKKHPADEKNSFHNPRGKFEKIFDKQELLDFYEDFEWIEEQRVEKDAEFFGKMCHCKHFWLILQPK